MKNDEFSEEYINSFIDKQLDTEEISQVFGDIENDQDLKKRVCELQMLKSMVQQAYDCPPPLPTVKKKRSTFLGFRWFSRSAVAGVTLMVGVLAGWAANNQFNQHDTNFPVSGVSVEATGKGAVLHLASSSPEKLKAALDKAENILMAYRKSKNIMPVEVVVNAGGLDLLRSDTSPFAERIGELQEKFDNLTFIACANAIQRFSNELGGELSLLPEAQTGESAIDRIIMRVRQGWSYHKI